MKATILAALASVLLLGEATPSPPSASPAPSPSEAVSAQAVLVRMVAAQSGLNTFSVPIHFDVTVHELVNLPMPLDGMRYFQRPDKEALIMNSVPAVASAFQRLYGGLGTPQTWPTRYDISLNRLASVPGPYELRGVPKKVGNVDHVLFDVARATAVPVEARWFYRNGSTIDLRIQNAQVAGRYWLPSLETVDIAFPQYKASAVAHYGQYSINQPIPSSVWQPSPGP